MSKKKILITGDSFVEGVGASGSGWAQQFATEQSSHAKVAVHGVGGQSSADLLTRIDGELAMAPDIVIVNIGTNDSRWRPSLGGHQVALSDFRRNLETLIARIGQCRAQPVFVSLTRVDEARTDPYKDDKIYRNAYLEIYAEAIADTVPAHGGHVLAVPALATAPGTLSDGLHPSDHGHSLLLVAIRSGLDAIANNTRVHREK